MLENASVSLQGAKAGLYSVLSFALRAPINVAADQQLVGFVTDFALAVLKPNDARIAVFLAVAGTSRWWLSSNGEVPARSFDWRSTPSTFRRFFDPLDRDRILPALGVDDMDQSNTIACASHRWLDSP